MANVIDGLTFPFRKFERSKGGVRTVVGGFADSERREAIDG